ncbi:MAG: GNAT family N-acetyltransferase [bacterium]
MKNNNFKIEFFDYVPDDISTFAYEEFKKHNIKQIGYFGIFQWCFVAKEGEKIIGIATGKLIFGGLHVKDLVIASEFRGKGIGTMLLQKVLNYGKENKCKFAYLETLSFQALDFYKRFGFEVDFERKGYDEGITLYYLSKEL